MAWTLCVIVCPLALCAVLVPSSWVTLCAMAAMLLCSVAREARTWSWKGGGCRWSSMTPSTVMKSSSFVINWDVFFTYVGFSAVYKAS